MALQHLHQQSRHDRRRRLSIPVLGMLLLLVIVSLGYPTSGLAQQGTSLTMRVQSRRVVMGNPLILQLTARGEFDDVTPPSSDGFDFRQTGRSSQMSIIGAQVTRSLVLTYQGTPRRPGKWTVMGAVLTQRGKAVARTGNVEIEVLDGRTALGRALPPEQASALRRYANEQFFVRPVLSSPRPYVGQPLVISYELYWVRGAAVQGIRELSEPTFTGFEVEDLLGGQPQKQQQVRIGGRIFFRQVTRKMLLIASEPGKFELLGPRYRVDVGDIFDSRALKIGPPPVAIEVRAVPETGRPKSYEEDAIGRLSLRASLLRRGQPTARLQVKAGERSVLAYVVSGTGNLLSLPTIAPPKVAGMTVTPLPVDAERGIKRTTQGIEGKRTWQYLVSFSTPGTVVIPGFTWSHFDPKKGRFESVRVQDLTVDVEADPSAVAAKAAAKAGGKGTGATGEPGSKQGSAKTEGAKRAPTGGDSEAIDLQPMAARAGLADTAQRTFIEAPWFWPASGAPWAAALLLLLAWQWRRQRRESHDARHADGALQTALTALTAATDHVALRRSVATYVLARGHITIAGLTSAGLQAALRSRGISAAAASHLVMQLEHCDYARFAPGIGDEELLATAKNIAEALTAMDAMWHDVGPAAADRNGRSGGFDGLSNSNIRRSVGWFVLGCGWLLSGPNQASAATLDQSFQTANAAYLSGDLAAAKRGYEALLDHGLQAAAVHYNLGNVLTRLALLGEAMGHYRQAQRLHPNATLRADIDKNLQAVRGKLAERSRRNHSVLHVFDESPELDVAMARAAPRPMLGALVLLMGGVALLLFGWALFGSAGRWVPITAGLAVLVQLSAGAWLLAAQRVDREVRHAVVVEEDAALLSCQGEGERLDLPEGLEVRIVRQRPDGRTEVRLPNGRSGCLAAAALVTIAEHRP